MNEINIGVVWLWPGHCIQRVDCATGSFFSFLYFSCHVLKTTQVITSDNFIVLPLENVVAAVRFPFHVAAACVCYARINKLEN